jgi:hypothetical protein
MPNGKQLEDARASSRCSLEVRKEIGSVIYLQRLKRLTLEAAMYVFMVVELLKLLMSALKR